MLSNPMLCAFVLLCMANAVCANASWFAPLPRAENIYHVVAVAEHPIRDGSKETPFDIADIETLPPKGGDMFVLGNGVYHAKLDFKHSGNDTAPIVITGAPGARATIVGKVDIDADNVWLMNVEITDPENKHMVSSAVDLRGNNLRVINCIIHDTFVGHGINAFYGYKGQVIYGNIIYRTGRIAGSRPAEELPTDAIRATNHFENDGYKYIVNNLIVEMDDVCDKCRGFSGHSDPDDGEEFDKHHASGFFVEGNIFDKSQAVVGGYGPPSHNNIIKGNYFGESELQIGFAAPTQAEVTDNIIAWSYLDSRYIWGQGDMAYGDAPKPNIYQRNTVLHPPVDNDLSRNDDLPLVDLGSAVYTDAEAKGKMGVRPVLGTALFPPGMVFDSNKYVSPSGFFRLNVAGMKVDEINSLESWQNITRDLGHPFDTSSVIATGENMTSVVHLIDNQYDKHRAYYAVFNYARDEKVSLDLQSAFPAISGTYEVFRATERWDEKPVATGVLPQTSVEVHVDKKRFASFIIIANKGLDPEFFPAEIIDECPRFQAGCESGPCRETEPKCILADLECSPNGKCNVSGARATAPNFLLLATTLFALLLLK